jgi:hypothetical protein
MTDGFVVRTDDFDIVPAPWRVRDHPASKRDSSLRVSLGLPPGAAQQPARRVDRRLRVHAVSTMRVNIAHCVCGWPSPPMVP